MNDEAKLEIRRREGRKELPQGRVIVFVPLRSFRCRPVFVVRSFPFPTGCAQLEPQAQRCQRRSSVPRFPEFPEEPKKKHATEYTERADSRKTSGSRLVACKLTATTEFTETHRIHGHNLSRLPDTCRHLSAGNLFLLFFLADNNSSG